MGWYKDRTRHCITTPTKKKDKDPVFQLSGGKIHGLVQIVRHNYRYFVQHGIESEVDYIDASCGQLEIDPSGGDDGHDANDDDHDDDDDVNVDGVRGRGRGCSRGHGRAPALVDEPADHYLGPADHDIGPTDHDMRHIDGHDAGPSSSGGGPASGFVGGSSESDFFGFSGGHASGLAGGPIGSGFITFGSVSCSFGPPSSFGSGYGGPVFGQPSIFGSGFVSGVGSSSGLENTTPRPVGVQRHPKGMFLDTPLTTVQWEHGLPITSHERTPHDDSSAFRPPLHLLNKFKESSNSKSRSSNT